MSFLKGINFSVASIELDFCFSEHSLILSVQYFEYNNDDWYLRDINVIHVFKSFSLASKSQNVEVQSSLICLRIMMYPFGRLRTLLMSSKDFPYVCKYPRLYIP